MASASWTLKVEFQGERRRLKDWVPEGEEPTVALARSGAVLLFELPPCHEQQVKLQYKDNDDEVCTLTDMTFPDALCLAVESRTLRVIACISEVAAEQPSAASVGDNVRVNLQDGGARLRESLEQLGTNVSSSLQNGQAGVEQFRTSVTSSVQDGRIRAQAQAQQLGANIQESRASLRMGAGQFVEDLGTNLRQISSEIQTNLQEGREGFKTRSEQLGGDLREGSLQLRQSLTKSVDGLVGGENSPESSKVRMASAVVAGGATLVVTRSLPLAVTLGAMAAGAAGVRAMRGADAQESAGLEVGTSDLARPSAELSAADAEDLVDSDVISLPSSSVGDSDAQDTQNSVIDTMQVGEEEDEDGMVLVHAESGSASGCTSEAAAE